MKYRALPKHLHSTANAVESYLKKQLGAKGIVAEEAVDNDIGFSPTLSGRAVDHHLVGVEVTDSGWNLSLDAFVLDCQRKGVPVLFYLAFPRGATLTDFQTLQRRANETGIGLLGIDAQGHHLYRPPISLSLAGLRSPDLKRFPVKYRAALTDAENTFRNGDPPKGCARVYDELEMFSRRLAAKVESKNLWKRNPTGRRPANFELCPWANLVTYLRQNLSYARLPRGDPKLNEALLNQVHSMTPHRNDTGHKPRTKAQLVSRDREMRTRFEHAVDTLERLVKATRGLRI